MAKAKTTIKKITQNAWECTKIFKTGEIEKRIVKDPIDIWSIGNTGVRNPWRIPGGYKVYVESNQVGKIRTAQEQKLFKEKLLLAGEIGGDPKKDADASITRKYRLMFNKYGFAYPEVLKKDGFSQKEIGKIDDITPAGWAFYHANTIQAQQECFLRGLVVQMEPLGERETYSPLRWVLKIMFDLFERTGDYKINYIEFAVCVQTSSPKYELETVVNKILEIRGRRKKYINKKKFDRDLIHNAWKHYFKEEKNFHEYADMNLRYLSASGILKRSGRGITVMPEYKSLAYELTKNVISDATLKERYKLLCQEAMEGEPVRRHVADLVQKYKKPVYGLFVANKIDSNTAETFRMGVWYTTQDERLELHIVPLTLTQFSEYFKFIFTENFAEPQKIVDLMCNCENYRKICEGPEWKKCINEVVQIMTKR